MELSFSIGDVLLRACENAPGMAERQLVLWRAELDRHADKESPGSREVAHVIGMLEEFIAKQSAERERFP